MNENVWAGTALEGWAAIALDSHEAMTETLAAAAALGIAVPE